MYCHRLLFVFAIYASVAGCQGDAGQPQGRLHGRVLFSDAPVKSGQVTVYSTALGSGGTAVLNEQGEYRFSEPLAAGDYKVAVLPPEPPPPTDEVPVAQVVEAADIPAKYRTFETSDLVLTLKSGNNEFDIRMTP